MDLQDFLPKQQHSHAMIQKDVDTDKYKSIVNKLCSKRNTLETELKEPTLTDAAREEKALDLMQLKESMRAFGISEVDYQLYLTQGDHSGEQLELF